MNSHPWLRLLLSSLLLFTPVPVLTAQDMVESGPKVGELLPGSFHPFNVNGPYGIKRNAAGEVTELGRHHCLVCEYGLNPVAAVFVREQPGAGNDQVVNLLKKLDEAVEKDPNGALRSFAVFLSPHATSSVTETALPEDARTKDVAKLVEQAVEREKLQDRVEQLARDAGLKKVVVGYYPAEGPKGYNLSDKAEVTVLLYQKHKVLANFAFAPGELTAASVDAVLQAVGKHLLASEPAPVEKKG